MDTPLITLLAKFIADEPARSTELVTWLLANGHFSKDLKAFVPLVKEECEQNLETMPKPGPTGTETVDLLDGWYSPEHKQFYHQAIRQANAILKEAVEDGN